MTDVVAAALIAAGVGVGGYVSTTWVALKTTGRQTLAYAKQLQNQHREDDRRVRRDAYAQLLVAVERLDMLTSVYTRPPTMEDFEGWLAHFRAAAVAVRLVESPDVAETRAALGRLLNTLTDKVLSNAELGMPMIDALGAPYVEMRPELAHAGHALGDAMRDDLAFAA